MANTVLHDFGEHKMYLLRNDPGISRTLAKPDGYKNREKAFMTILREEVAPGMIALDIGANIGYATLIMALNVGGTGKVVAVEPVKKNFDVLVKNVELNGYENIECHNIALSNSSGSKTFYETKASNLGALNPAVKFSKKKKLPVLDASEFLETQGIYPNFIKMDIEGHEVEVLNSLCRWFSNPFPCKVLIEVHPTLYSSSAAMADALYRLRDLGFRAKYVVSAATARPDLFIQRGYEPSRSFETSGWTRGIYVDVDYDDMVTFASKMHKQYVEERKRYSKKIVRSILLERS